MSTFWQAKIWGLLHDPLLKSLYKDKSQQGIWEEVLLFLGNSNPSALKQQIKDADFIAAASDRPAWDQDKKHGSVDYEHAKGLHISHLLSGSPQPVVVNGQTDAHREQDRELKDKEADIIRKQLFPLLNGLSTDEQHQKAFWWLWRCLPVAITREFGDNTALLPADTRIPDCSVWSHNSSVSALAGSLVGLEDTKKSRPYLVIFTMTPVQEMIKASRKMQDFWAGSWLLHYLSAKVCWKWAQKYGPDSLVYPSLYAQPLIDHWLRKRWSDFDRWVEKPSPKQLLTAGFPNVLVAVLPEHVVCNEKGNALASAEGILREVWLELGNKVWEKLPRKTNVSKERLWGEWLKHQWQTYWTATPLGKALPNPSDPNQSEDEKKRKLLESSLKMTQGVLPVKGAASPLQSTRDARNNFLQWANAQNQFCQTKLLPENPLDVRTLKWDSKVFLDPESYVDKNCPSLAELLTYKDFNVGLWWAYVFDQLRRNLAGVKNARSWELPSAFSPRSTISGIGPVLHPQQYDPKTRNPVDWVSESETRRFWQQERGWFSGQEQLNSTEVLKRGLEKILADPEVLGIDNNEIASYPDLTAGVAGYLKVMGHLKVNEKSQMDRRRHFYSACARILESSWTADAFRDMGNRWGIPYMKDTDCPEEYHPRLINAGWLAEDAATEEIKDKQNQIKQKQNLLDREKDKVIVVRHEEDIDKLQREISQLKSACRLEIQGEISSFYPSNNPSDWYVLAVGDGDDMGKWLQGLRLQPYQDYVSENYPDFETRKNWEGVEEFLQSRKRMGPATHAALSRALLDFSNQLLPYLTEQRYAGRLIYSGGDDVLAYTNLWEWDQWLWDVHQCFKGNQDPHDEFDDIGDYWRWKKEEKGNPPENVSPRPLFTMGGKASISFGMVVAHHSVPLAIALENLWEAEKEGAKKHQSPDGAKKDAVQVRVVYGSGNVLKSTAKFKVFRQWRSLLTLSDVEPALFEQAAEIWKQHPVPIQEAITPWTKAFCSRREQLKNDDEAQFQQKLARFLQALWIETSEHDRDREIQNWLKLAAFTLRNRDIKIGGEQ